MQEKLESNIQDEVYQKINNLEVAIKYGPQSVLDWIADFAEFEDRNYKYDISFGHDKIIETLREADYCILEEKRDSNEACDKPIYPSQKQFTEQAIDLMMDEWGKMEEHYFNNDNGLSL